MDRRFYIRLILLWLSATGAFAQQQQAPSATTQDNELLFNFQQADIHAVVKTISQLTGRNFLLDPRVKGTITIISSTPVSRAAAYQIFLSALKAQGFTAVSGPGGVTKIVPEAEARQSAPVASGKVARAGDQLVTQVVEVEQGRAADLVPLVRPLMSPNGLLSVYTPANTLVITDYADNIRRLTRLIGMVDQPPGDVTFIPMEHASAIEMADLLSRLIGAAAAAVPAAQAGAAQAAAAGPPGLSIIPDARTNSLLVQTDSPAILNRVRALIAQLDVPARQGGNTRVIYLRNAEAENIAQILRGLIAGEARAQAPARAPAGGAAATGAAAAPASLVQAHEESNALVINAPDPVYNNIRAVIEKLDIRRAQVFVEALIAEVSMDRSSQFGFQWFAASEAGDGSVGAVANFPFTGSGIVDIVQNPLGVGAGLSLAYLGDRIRLPDGSEVRGLGALARALQEDADTNILSTPNLLTLDNAEARIVVGQNVPFVTGRYSQTAAATTAGVVNPFQTIERRDVGLTLRIKPQISEGRGIKLQIFQEVSSVARTATTGAQDLVTNKRALETTVLVDDGHTVVLGGLIDDTFQESVQEVPLLSKIPLLGELFRYRERVKRKTNLMIFLRPMVARSAADMRAFTESRYEYIRGQQLGTEAKPTWAIRRYDTPALPPLEQPPIVPEESVPPPATDQSLLGPPQITHTAPQAVSQF